MKVCHCTHKTLLDEIKSNLRHSKTTLVRRSDLIKSCTGPHQKTSFESMLVPYNQDVLYAEGIDRFVIDGKIYYALIELLIEAQNPRHYAFPDLSKVSADELIAALQEKIPKVA